MDKTLTIEKCFDPVIEYLSKVLHSKPISKPGHDDSCSPKSKFIFLMSNYDLSREGGMSLEDMLSLCKYSKSNKKRVFKLASRRLYYWEWFHKMGWINKFRTDIANLSQQQIAPTLSEIFRMTTVVAEAIMGLYDDRCWSDSCLKCSKGKTPGIFIDIDNDPHLKEDRMPLFMFSWAFLKLLPMPIAFLRCIPMYKHTTSSLQWTILLSIAVALHRNLELQQMEFDHQDLLQKYLCVIISLTSEYPDRSQNLETCWKRKHENS
jgi:hypothetical protein